MNIQQIRNATILLHYGGKKFLIDPFLAKKGAYSPFKKTLNQDLFNPTVDLPISIEEIINVDVVIVTHLHLDHFDSAAIELLPKHIRIIAQSKKEAETIKKEGFQNVEYLTADSTVGEIRLIRTDGKHGTGIIGKLMGDVSGVVFQHKNEKTLYIAGDTIFCRDVQNAIEAYIPEVIIVNGGAAQFLQGNPITMTKENIYETYKEAPEATILVSHMEAVNHCLLTRDELKSFIEEKGLIKNILVPYDGEFISL